MDNKPRTKPTPKYPLHHPLTQSLPLASEDPFARDRLVHAPLPNLPVMTAFYLRNIIENNFKFPTSDSVPQPQPPNNQYVIHEEYSHPESQYPINDIAANLSNGFPQNEGLWSLPFENFSHFADLTLQNLFSSNIPKNMQQYHNSAGTLSFQPFNLFNTARHVESVQPLKIEENDQRTQIQQGFLRNWRESVPGAVNRDADRSTAKHPQSLGFEHLWIPSKAVSQQNSHVTPNEDYFLSPQHITHANSEKTNLMGGITREERRKKIDLYLQKRKRRTYTKKIAYDCRKKVADQRIRVKGRFVTKEQALKMLSMQDTGYSAEEIKQMLMEKGKLEKKVRLC